MGDAKGILSVMENQGVTTKNPNRDMNFTENDVIEENNPALTSGTESHPLNLNEGVKADPDINRKEFRKKVLSTCFVCAVFFGTVSAFVHL